MLAEEAIRTDLSHQEFSTLWAWHRERLALALLLIGDTRGSLTTLAGLRQEGPRAAWRATKDHTAPYLVSRLKRRIR